MPTLQRILQPALLTEVVSQQMAAEKWILQFFGVEPGGRNERDFGHGREGKYRIFDNTRQIGRVTSPGTAAAIAPSQVVKEVPFVYPRMHEMIPLLAEELHNLSRIDDERTRDSMGEDMITRQSRFLAQKGGNWRAAMVAGAMRDSLYEHTDGQDRYWTFDSANALKRINFQMPAGNQNQLDMLGNGDIIDTSWDNPSANIPDHLAKINAAFQELYGGRLESVLITGAGWQNVINNDFVASQAGIATSPFRRFERVVGTREDGTPLNVAAGEITARPGVVFYITDEGLDLGAPGSETFTKYVEDTAAVFLPSTDTGIFTMHVAGEPIAEFDGAPQQMKRGFNAWARNVSNPTVTELFGLDNSLFVNHIPNSTAYGTVVFG